MQIPKTILGFAGAALPTFAFNSFHSTQCTSNHTISTDLGPLLSENASIILPSSSQFANATLRWQEWEDPDISVVVEVMTESDVMETVKYANKNNLPFLATTGGHGAISSLGEVENGIEILMRGMNEMVVSEDMTEVTVGGGVLQLEFVNWLWERGLMGVAGLCECTSIVGPMLGGGHGILQGQHGLLIDNLLSARLVLADGTAITVSHTLHQDLFWALRGAGHNFGVVTSFTYRVYPVPANDTWSYESFVFKGSEVEKLYSIENSLAEDEERREKVLFFSFWLWNLDVDTEGPVILLYALYHGSPSSAYRIFSPYHSLPNAAPIQSGTVTYPQISSLTGNGYDGIACGHGSTSLRFPIDVKTYNISGQRIVYERFKNITLQEPALNGSFFLFEAYPTNAVQKVRFASTAFPHRGDSLLLSSVMVYKPNATLDPIAIRAGKELREILHVGSGREEMHSYVNYGHGDEGVGAWYGFEKWRVKKLKKLKEVWDPKGRFGFYAPIPVTEES